MATEKDSARLRVAMDKLGLSTLLAQQSQQSSEEEEEAAGTTADRLRFEEEEAALEEMIVELILGGKWEVLQPNSGNAVTIGKHHVCVSYACSEESHYRAWEWHGHIMVHDEHLGGCTSEYVYGNFLEELSGNNLVSSSLSNSTSNFLLKHSLGFSSSCMIK